MHPSAITIICVLSGVIKN